MTNKNVITNLAITTAFFRADFDNQTRFDEVEDQNSWNLIAERALEYLKDAGIDTSRININKETIVKAIWGAN